MELQPHEKFPGLFPEIRQRAILEDPGNLGALSDEAIEIQKAEARKKLAKRFPGLFSYKE